MIQKPHQYSHIQDLKRLYEVRSNFYRHLATQGGSWTTGDCCAAPTFIGQWSTVMQETNFVTPSGTLWRVTKYGEQLPHGYHNGKRQSPCDGVQIELCLHSLSHPRAGTAGRQGCFCPSKYPPSWATHFLHLWASSTIALWYSSRGTRLRKVETSSCSASRDSNLVPLR